jgi:hypothetical protein
VSTIVDIATLGTRSIPFDDLADLVEGEATGRGRRRLPDLASRGRGVPVATP